MDLFLNFDGRIARGKWWLGVIVLVVIGIVLSAVVLMIFGAGMVGQVISLLVTLVLLYPIIALATKRLHDRGHDAMPRVAIFFGPGLLLTVMQTFGIGFRTEVVAGVAMQTPGLLGSIVGFVALVVGIWALIELGILRGNDGPNRFGPPPA